MKFMLKKADAVLILGVFLVVAALLIAGKVFPFVARFLLVPLIAAIFIGALLEVYRRLQYLFNKPVENYRQVEHLFSLFSLLKIRRPLPPMRHWAISPDFACLLLSLIDELHPKVIVELGSGVSTIINAYRLEALGEGKVVALDHDAAFAAQTRENLRRHGLSEWATVYHAPPAKLRVGGRVYEWYDLTQVPDLPPIDLLIVDGPITQGKPEARYPALPLLCDRLGEGAVMVLDDAGRPEETQIRRRWRIEFPDWREEYIANEKGAAVYRRSGEPRSGTDEP